MSKPKIISLYTGAGGLDLGLEAAGFEPLVCVEMNLEAVATLRLNRPQWQVMGDCLESRKRSRKGCVSPEEVVEEAGQGADLLVGGPPCQPFSKSGYWHQGDSARLDDPRADTLKAFLRTLDLAKPRAFLLENVPGIAFNKKREGLAYLEARLARIKGPEGKPYTIKSKKLNAAEFGVPQLRERLFVVGSCDYREFCFPEPTHVLPPRVDMTDPKPHTPLREVVDGMEPYMTAWDAIAHLDLPGLGDDDDLRMRGKYADLLATIPEGCNYLFHADKEGKAEKLFGWRTRYWSMLLKLAKARPSWTLTAQPGPAIGPFHWKNRRLSAEELCALQTFPAGYVITGDNRAAHRQVGNAVPSALSELLGLEIRRQFFGTRVRSTLKLLPGRQDQIPAAGRVRRALPSALRDEVRVRAPHRGVRQGPAAINRQATHA